MVLVPGVQCEQIMLILYFTLKAGLGKDAPPGTLEPDFRTGVRLEGTPFHLLSLKTLKMTSMGLS